VNTELALTPSCQKAGCLEKHHDLVSQMARCTSKFLIGTVGR
jgi:hypothetical protein